MSEFSTVTARTFVSDAMRKLGVVAHDEAMTADQADIGLRALDRMLKSWQNHGGVQWTVGGQSDLGAEVAVPVGFEDAVVYGLAARLIDDFNVNKPNIITRAEEELRLALASDRDNSVYFLPYGYEWYGHER